MDAPGGAKRAAPRTFSASEVDAALARLSDPERFTHATEVVTHAAPSLAGVLDRALAAGGWFDGAQEALVQEAAAESGPAERVAAIRGLLDEQTRLTMLVGVAIGFELREELARAVDPPITTEDG